MKIYAVNKNYMGTSAGVMFRDGMGETENPLLIEWFQTHGYTLEEDEKKSGKAEKKTGKKAED